MLVIQTKLSSSRSSGDRQGFTLLELLVVIGIIVVLVGILLPVLSKVMGQGVRTRIGSDLNAIATGLEAYKADFGDYPRILYFNNTTTVAMNGTASGAAVLGKALLGLGDQTTAAYSSGSSYTNGQIVTYNNFDYEAVGSVPAGTTPGPGSPSWVIILLGNGGCAGDGSNGLGFRVRAGGYGQVYGPYLQSDKFKTKGLALLDYVGNPILYYPGNPSKPNVTYDNNLGSFTSGNGNTYVSVPFNETPGTAPTGVPNASLSMYNYSDNDTAAVNAALNDSNIPNTFPSTVAGGGLKVMLGMLGNYSMDGYIHANLGESAASTAPYLLWSAGPDGIFGPVAATQNLSNFVTLTPTQVKNYVQKCDDVTNFNVGQ